MAEEDKEEKVSKKDEKALSVLEQAKAEREAVEKANEEARKLIEELNRLRSEDILSGRAPQPKQAVKEEETPQEYLKKVLANKL